MGIKEEFDSTLEHEQHEEKSSNPSGNRPFRDVLSTNLKRRSVL